MIQWTISLIRDVFSRRKAGPLAQFIRYGICGVIASFVDVGIFYALAIWVIPALGPDDPVAQLCNLNVPALIIEVRARHFVWDKIISFLFANFAAYILNVIWVFERGRHHWFWEIFYFYAVSSISVGIGVALGWILIQYFEFSTTVSFITQAVSTLLINFACRKFFIFHG